MPEFGYLLAVARDDEDHEKFRWVVLENDGEPGYCTLHQVAECTFDTWGDALNAGTIALAKAEGQPYENEAADPVGDATCAPSAPAAALSLSGSPA